MNWFEVQAAIQTDPRESGFASVEDLQAQLDEYPRFRNPRVLWQEHVGQIIVTVECEDLNSYGASVSVAEVLLELSAAVIEISADISVEVLSSV
jgi:hypothetical protein